MDLDLDNTEDLDLTNNFIDDDNEDGDDEVSMNDELDADLVYEGVDEMYEDDELYDGGDDDEEDDDEAAEDEEEHSNFRLFGIGKQSEGQKKRKAKRKKKRAARKTKRKERRKRIKGKIKARVNKIKLKGRALGDKIKKKLPKGVRKFIERNEGGRLMHKLNRINPATAIVRGAVISMLQVNLLGIASAFALMKDDTGSAGRKKHWEDLQQKWWMIGGKKSKLDSNVNRGKGKKKLFMKLFPKLNKMSSFDGSNADGKNLDNAGTAVGITAAALISATPILLAGTATAPAAVWTGASGGFLGVVAPIMKKYAKDAGAKAALLRKIPELPPAAEFPIPLTDAEMAKFASEAAAAEAAGTDGDGDEDNTIMGIPQTGFWVGTALLTALIVGGILLTRKGGKP